MEQDNEFTITNVVKLEKKVMHGGRKAKESRTRTVNQKTLDRNIPDRMRLTRKKKIFRVYKEGETSDRSEQNREWMKSLDSY